MTDRLGPWDPGLQPERTALAWRRTALALALGSLVAARLLVPAAGLPAALAAAAGLLTALGLSVASANRARTVARRLGGASPARALPGGALLAATAAALAIGGVLLAVLTLVDDLASSPSGVHPYAPPP